MTQSIEEFHANDAADNERAAIRLEKLRLLICSKKLINLYRGHNRVQYCLIADDIHLTGKTLDDIIDQLPG